MKEQNRLKRITRDSDRYSNESKLYLYGVFYNNFRIWFFVLSFLLDTVENTQKSEISNAIYKSA